MKIKFYRSQDPYGFLSNFARFSVYLDGKDWPTSEHYYQAQKTDDPLLQEQIRQVSNPGESKRLGMRVPLRPDWDQAKDDVMRKVVKAKFEQHPELLQMLLATGDSELIEHTKLDSYWGDGGNGKGKNMLGKVLMEVREELKGP